MAFVAPVLGFMPKYHNSFIHSSPITSFASMGFGQGSGVLVRPPFFEPLADASSRNKTRKALFLVAMASATRVGELQTLSLSVSHRGDDLVLHYDPFFLAKTESVSKPPSQINHSPVSSRLCWRPTRTGSLPSLRCSLSQMSCSLC